MTLPNEIKDLLSAAYVDISTENVEIVREYNNKMEAAIESGDFTEVISYWNENKEVLNQTILTASTINNIQNAILALENYIIEGKQTVKVNKTAPDDINTGDIWIQINENSEILGIHQWNGTGFENFLIKHPEISLNTDSTSASSMSTESSNNYNFTTIDNVIRDESGHVLKVNLKTITIPKSIYMGEASSSNKFKLLGTLTYDGISSNSNLAAYSSGPDDLYFVPGTGTIVAKQLKGNAETASKINVSELNPSSSRVFYPAMVYNSVANGDSALYDNKNVCCSVKNGTTNTLGQTFFIIGNSNAQGTADNTYGGLRLYGQNTHFVSIYDKDNVLTADHGLYLPDQNGTIAVTSDIKWDTLGYTPINPTSCHRITKYYNSSTSVKQRKKVTISFPCTIQGSNCYPRDLIRMTASRNTSSSSKVGTAVLNYVSSASPLVFDNVGGTDLVTTFSGATIQNNNFVTLEFTIEIYPFGFLFIEASDECSVTIASAS